MPGIDDYTQITVYYLYRFSFLLPARRQCACSDPLLVFVLNTQSAAPAGSMLS